MGHPVLKLQAGCFFPAAASRGRCGVNIQPPGDSPYSEPYLAVFGTVDRHFGIVQCLGFVRCQQARAAVLLRFQTASFSSLVLSSCGLNQALSDSMQRDSTRPMNHDPEGVSKTFGAPVRVHPSCGQDAAVSVRFPVLYSQLAVVSKR